MCTTALIATYVASALPYLSGAITRGHAEICPPEAAGEPGRHVGALIDWYLVNVAKKKAART